MKRFTGLLIVAIAWAPYLQAQQPHPDPHPIVPANQHPGEQPVDPALLSQNLPHIEIVGGAQSADFGRVLPADLYRSFTVRNNGTALLVFYGNSDTCRTCLGYDYDKGSLESGDTMQITMHFTLEQTAGALNSFVVIHSNDPQTPRLEVPVHIEVYRDVTMNPLNATIQDVHPCKDECKFTFTLKNTGDSAIRLSPPKLIKVEGMEIRFSMSRGITLKRGDTYSLDAYAKITKQPQGRHVSQPDRMYVPHAEAEIRTSSKATPVIDIPFYYLLSGK